MRLGRSPEAIRVLGEIPGRGPAGRTSPSVAVAGHWEVDQIYRMTSKVVEYEENRRIAWCHLVKNRWRYELEPTEGGTQLG